MEETSRLQGRGDGSERPENEGDLSPDHGERKDIAPIVVPDADDEGEAAAEEVAELTVILQDTAPIVKPLTGSEGESAPWTHLGNPKVSLKALEAEIEARKKRKKK